MNSVYAIIVVMLMVVIGSTFINTNGLPIQGQSKTKCFKDALTMNNFQHREKKYTPHQL